MTKLARFLRSKRSITLVGSQTIDKNLGTVQVSQYYTLPLLAIQKFSGLQEQPRKTKAETPHT